MGGNGATLPGAVLCNGTPRRITSVDSGLSTFELNAKELICLSHLNINSHIPSKTKLQPNKLGISNFPFGLGIWGAPF
jgi:hypothetical protein